MICLNNAAFLKAIETVREEAIAQTGADPHHEEIQQWIGRTVALILYMGSIMQAGEQVSDGIVRLQNDAQHYHILSQQHAGLLYGLLREIFTELSCRRFVVVGLADESAPYVTPLWLPGETPPPMPEVQKLLYAISQDEGGSTLEMI